MQETVTNTNDRKSLFSSFLEVLEAKEKQAQADRELQEEKYLRRTQRIYDFHERQRSEAAELRRCLEYVSQHAAVLEGALRGPPGGPGGPGGAGEGGGGVPLSAALAGQAAALARAMAACVANATAIRRRLAAPHDQRHMDQLLAKMEAELVGWRSFVQRAVEATASAETTRDNLHNLIAEQRRVVTAVCASPVLGGGEPSPSPSPPPADPLHSCSTPIPEHLP